MTGDIRLYAEDIDGAMRAANRAGGNAPVIARARFAVIKKRPTRRRSWTGCWRKRAVTSAIFSRAQWLRREHKATEAAELMLSVPKRSVETTAAALGRKIQNLYAGSESAEAAEVNGACHLFSITRASARTGHTHVELELPPHYFGSGGYSLPIEKDNFETG
jgi:hypothetical protein